MIFFFIFLFSTIVFLSLVYGLSVFFSLKKQDKEHAKRRSSFTGINGISQIVVTGCVLILLFIIILNRSAKDSAVDKRVAISTEEVSASISKLIKDRQDLQKNSIPPSGNNASSIPSITIAPSINEKNTKDSAVNVKTSDQLNMATQIENISSGKDNTMKSVNEYSEGSTYSEIRDLEKSLNPSTLRYADMLPKSGGDQNKRKRSFSIADVTGAQSGDLFIYSYYDMLKNGIFLRSKNLELFPPKDRSLPSEDTGTKQIRLGINIPPLRKNNTFQVPFLLNGTIEPLSVDTEYFTLDDTGTIRASKNTPEIYFTYMINRTQGQMTLTTLTNDSSLLKDEYNNIPYEIFKDLQWGIGRSDKNKLYLVTKLLNKYFSYQAGLLDVDIDGKDTWNELLGEKIENSGRFACDCDVLSTYSYIFLRYLNLRPYLLVGFLKAGESLNFLKSNDLHATLYVKIEDEWLIFEPTFFVDDQTGISKTLSDLAKERSASFLSPSQVSFNNSKLRMATAYRSSGLRYYIPEGKTLPEAGIPLDSLPDHPFSLKKMFFLANNLGLYKVQLIENSLKSKDIPTLVITISLVMYITGIILSQITVMLRGKNEKLLPLDLIYSSVFSLCIFISFMAITHKTVFYGGTYTNINDVVKGFAAISCFMAGSISIVSFLGFFTGTLQQTPLMVNCSAFLRSRSHFFAGMILNFTSAVFAPSFYTIGSFIVISKILYDYLHGLKNNERAN